MASHPSGIVITVSKEIIDRATKANSSHCMVAEAIKECRPDFKLVSVDIQSIRYTDYALEKRVFHLTPPAVQWAIKKFDEGDQDIKPFKFTLRQPHYAPMHKTRAKPAATEPATATVTGRRSKSKSKPAGITTGGGGGGGSQILSTESKRGWPQFKVGSRRQFGLRALAMEVID